MRHDLVCRRCLIAQIRLLYNVLRLRDAAKHPVGDRKQERAVRLKLLGVNSIHGLSPANWRICVSLEGRPARAVFCDISPLDLNPIGATPAEAPSAFPIVSSS